MRKFLLAASILGTLAVLSTAAAILDEETQAAAALAAGPTIAAPISTSGPVCQVQNLEAGQLFPSFLDELQQGSCSCTDQCRFDFQCVQLYGPGSTCQPVGPCGCKECLATS